MKTLQLDYFALSKFRKFAERFMARSNSRYLFMSAMARASQSRRAFRAGLPFLL